MKQSERRALARQEIRAALNVQSANERARAEEKARLAVLRGHDPCVYFIHAPSVGLIKIGFSVDVTKRFVDVRTGSPVPVELIGTMAARTIADEAAVHQRFRKLRSHGEWFRAEPELISFIAENVGARGRTAA